MSQLFQNNEFCTDENEDELDHLLPQLNDDHHDQVTDFSDHPPLPADSPPSSPSIIPLQQPPQLTANSITGRRVLPIPVNNYRSNDNEDSVSFSKSVPQRFLRQSHEDSEGDENDELTTFGSGSLSPKEHVQKKKKLNSFYNNDKRKSFISLICKGIKLFSCKRIFYILVSLIVFFCGVVYLFPHDTTRVLENIAEGRSVFSHEAVEKLIAKRNSIADPYTCRKRPIFVTRVALRNFIGCDSCFTAIEQNIKISFPRVGQVVRRSIEIDLIFPNRTAQVTDLHEWRDDLGIVSTINRIDPNYEAKIVFSKEHQVEECGVLSSLAPLTKAEGTLEKAHSQLLAVLSVNNKNENTEDSQRWKQHLKLEEPEQLNQKKNSINKQLKDARQKIREHKLKTKNLANDEKDSEYHSIDFTTDDSKENDHNQQEDNDESTLTRDSDFNHLESSERRFALELKKKLDANKANPQANKLHSIGDMINAIYERKKKKNNNSNSKDINENNNSTIKLHKN